MCEELLRSRSVPLRGQMPTPEQTIQNSFRDIGSHQNWTIKEETDWRAVFASSNKLIQSHLGTTSPANMVLAVRRFFLTKSIWDWHAGFRYFYVEDLSSQLLLRIVIADDNINWKSNGG